MLGVLSLVSAACASDATTVEQGVAETEAADSSTEATTEEDDSMDDENDDDSARDDDPDDEDSNGEDSDSEESNGESNGDEEEEEEEPAALTNDCPAEGCEVEITDAAAGPDGEIELTFDANYLPDFSQNHIHVFWDSQEPGAVSSDYAAKGFAEQGKWHPTDEYPSYVTQSDASVNSASRGSSTALCVTAADGNHAVIDANLYACLDVTDLLGS